MLESKFKAELIRKLKRQFPGAIILKTDANSIQGIPDNIILFRNKWAAFEAKKSIDAPHQENQDYYVELLNSMSYASFVYPECEEEFLDELQYTLRPSRRARILKS